MVLKLKVFDSVMADINIFNSGDSAIYCCVGDSVSPALNEMVYALENYILGEVTVGIIETVPSYNGLMIYFDPLTLDRDKLSGILSSFSYKELQPLSAENRGTIVIPVYYGSDQGPDLDIVSSTNNMKPEDVIAIHTGTDYRIYMLGFTPGFPYLGGLDKRIATPRKTEPRLKIAAGSVGIAGEQTGIYPIESPGGWQIIGRTPVKLFTPESESPFLLKPGLTLRFRQIAIEEYIEIQRIAENMEYKPEFISD